jgi:hypothetical protein|tara:strand:- start:13 stop:738 length:726 start_codon:yes stop_codon:yes gene_type:complete
MAADGARRRVITDMTKTDRLKWARPQWLLRPILLSALCTLLASCTHTLTVTGRIPTPLIEPFPVSIGLIVPAEFSTYIYREKLPRGGGDWTVGLGALQDAFFTTLFDSVFQRVQRVSLPVCEQIDAPNAPGLGCPDGYLRITLLEYAFLPPELSGLKFFSASTKYQLELMDAGGAVRDTWVVVGYGKNEGGGFQATDALNAASVDAIRDAGARVALDWSKQENVVTWLDSIGRNNDPKPIM